MPIYLRISPQTAATEPQFHVDLGTNELMVGPQPPPPSKDEHHHHRPLGGFGANSGGHHAKVELPPLPHHHDTHEQREVKTAMDTVFPETLSDEKMIPSLVKRLVPPITKRRNVTVVFTGPSGSGKSTFLHALVPALLTALKNAVAAADDAHQEHILLAEQAGTLAPAGGNKRGTVAASKAAEQDTAANDDGGGDENAAASAAAATSGEERATQQMKFHLFYTAVVNRQHTALIDAAPMLQLAAYDKEARDAEAGLLGATGSPLGPRGRAVSSPDSALTKGSPPSASRRSVTTPSTAAHGRRSVASRASTPAVGSPAAALRPRKLLPDLMQERANSPSPNRRHDHVKLTGILSPNLAWARQPHKFLPLEAPVLEGRNGRGSGPQRTLYFDGESTLVDCPRWSSLDAPLADVAQGVRFTWWMSAAQPKPRAAQTHASALLENISASSSPRFGGTPVDESDHVFEPAVVFEIFDPIDVKFKLQVIFNSSDSKEFEKGSMLVFVSDMQSNTFEAHFPHAIPDHDWHLMSLTLTPAKNGCTLVIDGVAARSVIGRTEKPSNFAGDRPKFGRIGGTVVKSDDDQGPPQSPSALGADGAGEGDHPAMLFHGYLYDFRAEAVHEEATFYHYSLLPDNVDDFALRINAGLNQNADGSAPSSAAGLGMGGGPGGVGVNGGSGDHSSQIDPRHFTDRTLRNGPLVAHDAANLQVQIPEFALTAPNFDGKTYVSLGLLGDLGLRMASMTLELTIRTGATGEAMCAVGVMDTPGKHTGFGLELNTQNAGHFGPPMLHRQSICFWVRAFDGKVARCAAEVPQLFDDRWHTLSVTVVDSMTPTFRIRLDGRAIECQATGSVMQDQLLSFSKPVFLGAFSDRGDRSRPFYGSLRDVKIGYAKDGEEFTVGQWALDEGPGATLAVDATKNGMHGLFYTARSGTSSANPGTSSGAAQNSAPGDNAGGNGGNGSAGGGAGGGAGAASSNGTGGSVIGHSQSSKRQPGCPWLPVAAGGLGGRGGGGGDANDGAAGVAALVRYNNNAVTVACVCVHAVVSEDGTNVVEEVRDMLSDAPLSYDTPLVLTSMAASNDRLRKDDNRPVALLPQSCYAHVTVQNYFQTMRKGLARLNDLCTVSVICQLCLGDAVTSWVEIGGRVKTGLAKYVPNQLSWRDALSTYGDDGKLALVGNRITQQAERVVFDVGASPQLHKRSSLLDPRGTRSLAPGHMANILRHALTAGPEHAELFFCPVLHPQSTRDEALSVICAVQHLRSRARDDAVVLIQKTVRKFLARLEYHRLHSGSVEKETRGRRADALRRMYPHDTLARTQRHAIIAHFAPVPPAAGTAAASAEIQGSAVSPAFLKATTDATKIAASFGMLGYSTSILISPTPQELLTAIGSHNSDSTVRTEDAENLKQVVVYASGSAMYVGDGHEDEPLRMKLKWVDAAELRRRRKMIQSFLDTYLEVYEKYLDSFHTTWTNDVAAAEAEKKKKKKKKKPALKKGQVAPPEPLDVLNSMIPPEPVLDLAEIRTEIPEEPEIQVDDFFFRPGWVDPEGPLDGEFENDGLAPDFGRTADTAREDALSASDDCLSADGMSFASAGVTTPGAGPAGPEGSRPSAVVLPPEAAVLASSGQFGQGGVPSAGSGDNTALQSPTSATAVKPLSFAAIPTAHGVATAARRKSRRRSSAFSAAPCPNIVFLGATATAQCTTEDSTMLRLRDLREAVVGPKPQRGRHAILLYDATLAPTAEKFPGTPQSSHPESLSGLVASSGESMQLRHLTGHVSPLAYYLTKALNGCAAEHVRIGANPPPEQTTVETFMKYLSAKIGPRKSLGILTAEQKQTAWFGEFIGDMFLAPEHLTSKDDRRKAKAQSKRGTVVRFVLAFTESPEAFNGDVVAASKFVVPDLVGGNFKAETNLHRATVSGTMWVHCATSSQWVARHPYAGALLGRAIQTELCGIHPDEIPDDQSAESSDGVDGLDVTTGDMSKNADVALMADSPRGGGAGSQRQSPTGSPRVAIIAPPSLTPTNTRSKKSKHGVPPLGDVSKKTAGARADGAQKTRGGAGSLLSPSAAELAAAKVPKWRAFGPRMALALEFTDDVAPPPPLVSEEEKLAKEEARKEKERAQRKNQQSAGATGTAGLLANGGKAKASAADDDSDDDAAFHFLEWKTRHDAIAYQVVIPAFTRACHLAKQTQEACLCATEPIEETEAKRKQEKAARTRELRMAGRLPKNFERIDQEEEFDAMRAKEDRLREALAETRSLWGRLGPFAVERSELRVSVLATVSDVEAARLDKRCRLDSDLTNLAGVGCKLAGFEVLPSDALAAFEREEAEVALWESKQGALLKAKQQKEAEARRGVEEKRMKLEKTLPRLLETLNDIARTGHVEEKEFRQAFETPLPAARAAALECTTTLVVRAQGEGCIKAGLLDLLKLAATADDPTCPAGDHRVHVKLWKLAATLLGTPFAKKTIEALLPACAVALDAGNVAGKPEGGKAVLSFLSTLGQMNERAKEAKGKRQSTVGVPAMEGVVCSVEDVAKLSEAWCSNGMNAAAAVASDLRHAIATLGRQTMLHAAALTAVCENSTGFEAEMLAEVCQPALEKHMGMAKIKLDALKYDLMTPQPAHDEPRAAIEYPTLADSAPEFKIACDVLEVVRTLPMHHYAPTLLEAALPVFCGVKYLPPALPPPPPPPPEEPKGRAARMAPPKPAPKKRPTTGKKKEVVPELGILDYFAADSDRVMHDAVSALLDHIDETSPPFAIELDGPGAVPPMSSYALPKPNGLPDPTAALAGAGGSPMAGLESRRPTSPVLLSRSASLVPPPPPMAATTAAELVSIVKAHAEVAQRRRAEALEAARASKIEATAVAEATAAAEAKAAAEAEAAAAATTEGEEKNTE